MSPSRYNCFREQALERRRPQIVSLPTLPRYEHPTITRERQAGQRQNRKELFSTVCAAIVVLALLAFIGMTCTVLGNSCKQAIQKHQDTQAATLQQLAGGN